ncbi:MAG: hypothetical protein Kow00109_10230 [Acidobacteriota bacterium]
MQDKFQVLRFAEKFVVNRQFDKAIEEYRRIVETHGEDPAVLNTLGDLYLKTHRRQEALECFRRVAEIFSQGGFVSKAIAIYRKIAQIAPEDREVLRRLAELFTRRGLRIEAVRYWRKLAEAAERAGDKEERITAWREVVSLQPQDPQAHLELARALAPLVPREAVEHYLTAARRLMDLERWEDAAAAAREALALDAGAAEAGEILERCAAEGVQVAAGEEGPGAEEGTEPAGAEIASSPAFSAGGAADDLFEEAYFAEPPTETAPPEAASAAGELFDGSAEPGPAAPPPPPGVEAEAATRELGDEAFFELEESHRTAGDEETVTEEAAAEDETETSVDPLQARLEEVDFYLKLSMQEEAERILRELLAEHPEDERVKLRAERIGLGGEAEKVPPAEEPSLEAEVEAALDEVFFEELPEEAAFQDLGLESSEETAASPLEVGKSYAEMEMWDEAARKFEEAYYASIDAGDPETVLECCLRLVECYARLQQPAKVVEWADIGLSLPQPDATSRWRLEYLRSRALEEIGEIEEALEGYRRIRGENAEYEDVVDRVNRLEAERS